MKTLLSLVLLLVFIFSPTVLGENNSFNRKRTFDAEHYVMQLSFDRKNKIVFANSSIKLKPLTPNFTTIELDAKDIKFESIRLRENKKELEYKTIGKNLIITLDRVYNPNESLTVDFKYSAKPQKGIYFVDEIKKRGKITRNSQIWTQGESEETHHWLPSFDFPDDKATTEQIITVNKGETVVGNGELIKRKENPNNTVTYHYKMPVPHSLYLTSFIVGTYNKVTDKYKDIPIGYYVYPGQEVLVKNAYGKTKDMFRIFEELTGVDYPYNKYDQTMVAEFQFGGMENITATTMADTEILMSRFKFAQPLVEDLVAHELAHSWFGNLVTCRNWAELWLNEGFATFMEAAYREKMYGRKQYIDKIQSDATEFFTYVSLREKSQHGLFNQQADARNDETMFTPITYQKGGAVVHTLREELGDEAFWKGVNLYLTRHKFANVETKDLQKVMEEVSKKDLDWFFKQWVYGIGYPKIRIKPIYSASSKTLKLTLSQIQNQKTESPQIFRLPLEVELRTPSGIENKKIILDKRLQEVEFKLKSKPMKITFDKDYKIPLKDISQSRLRTIK